MMRFVFTNIIWKGDPLEAYIYYSALDGDDMLELKLSRGERIDIRFGDGRYCTGSEREKGEWLTCTSNQKAQEKYPKTVHLERGKQCEECISTNFFDCRMRCQGDVCIPSSDAAKSYCEPANTMVYLTNVAGINKVGVSLGLPRRWIEQGSDYAVHIATAPGLEARRIEFNIAQRLHAQLMVRTKDKLKKLGGVPRDVAEDSLGELITGSRPIIEEVMTRTDGVVLNNPNVVDLRKRYGRTDFGHITISKPIPGNEFGGVIQAVKGSVLIVQEGDHMLALNLRQMIAFTFEFLDKSADQTAETIIDDWF